MGRPIQNIQSLRENIKKELHLLYPEREINSIADILIGHRLGLKRHEMGSQRLEKLCFDDAEWFAGAIVKIRDHTPVQYITGTMEFLGIPLKTAPGVLIPRPETEELVDWIVKKNHLEKPRILDIGTGSGCIALALKKMIPGSQVTGTDISGPSLALAIKNAELLHLKVRFMNHDIHTGHSDLELKNLDIIVSNPPYIPESQKPGMDRNVTLYEPSAALFVPDHDPMIFNRQIAVFSRDHLTPGGNLYIEFHENFAEQTRDLMVQHGFSEVCVRQDLNGKNRMLNCHLR